MKFIAITSPAKSLDYETEYETSIKPTAPVFIKNANKIAKALKNFDTGGIKDILNVSEKLAELNYNRYQEWSNLETKPAILAYNGDIYKQFDSNSFNAKQECYIQKHLRVISGLYGILRPYDLVKPYRLEMSTIIERLGLGYNNLYDLWKEQITNQLNKENIEYLVNLASNEYFKAIDKGRLESKIINIEFRQLKEGEEKNFGIYAKKGRGLFIKFLLENQIEKIDDLKSFDYEGYKFTKDREDSIYFTKEV